MHMEKSGNGGGLSSEQKGSLHNNGFAYATPNPKIKRLWTNPAPLEDFDKQTVALDLSEYDLILISFMNGDNANYVVNAFFFVGSTTQTANGFSGSQKNHRNITVSSNGVAFLESYKYATYGASVSGTIDYSVMRPLYIYGIKL